MTAKTFNVGKLQLRHDTAANWRTQNPILSEGEAGIEVDTHKIKVGDGSTTWNNLDYANAVDLSSYLKTSTAANTYVTKTELEDVINENQVDLSGYLTKTDASNTYATKTSLSSYLTKTEAANTYLVATGTAASATKLATARTISLSGSASGSVSFNGSADVDIEVTLPNTYTKTEVDELIENISSGGDSSGGSTTVSSFVDITAMQTANIPFSSTSLEMYVFDIKSICNELSISGVKFIEVCLFSMVGWDSFAWFDCILTDTAPATEFDYYSINKLLAASSGQNQQVISGVSVLLPPHMAARYLVIINYYGGGASSGNTNGEYYVRLHM